MKQFTLFALTLLLAACKTATPNPDPNCIQRIIDADNVLGKTRNHACETISMAETIQNYADGMAKLDFRGCPPDFAKAFERHRQAWIDMIPLVEKYPDMRGEMHVLFDQLEKGPDAETFKPLLKAIWDTWAEVEAAMK
mgnify:CR=1 FL=1